MKKSKNKNKNKDINLENMLEDMEILMEYVNTIKQTKVEDLNLAEIEKKTEEFKEKYKDIIPKENLDTKK